MSVTAQIKSKNVNVVWGFELDMRRWPDHLNEIDNLAQTAHPRFRAPDIIRDPQLLGSKEAALLEEALSQLVTAEMTTQQVHSPHELLKVRCLSSPTELRGLACKDAKWAIGIDFSEFPLTDRASIIRLKHYRSKGATWFVWVSD